jgi:hypothetical protein
MNYTHSEAIKKYFEFYLNFVIASNHLDQRRPKFWLRETSRTKLFLTWLH